MSVLTTLQEIKHSFEQITQLLRHFYGFMLNENAQKDPARIEKASKIIASLSARQDALTRYKQELEGSGMICSQFHIGY